MTLHETGSGSRKTSGRVRRISWTPSWLPRVGPAWWHRIYEQPQDNR
jgi:hypothetical protein